MAIKLIPQNKRRIEREVERYAITFGLIHPRDIRDARGYAICLVAAVLIDPPITGYDLDAWLKYGQEPRGFD